MPIVNRIAGLHEEATAWRRDFHQHPELQFDLPRTSAIVADRLREFGCDEVVTGIGRTGVVGVIRGKSTASGRVVGLRSDMDALPLTEITGLAHASTVPGKMHACGHDGHMAMLLGAGKYLAETRNFDGTAILIFQPAEEGGGGAREMVADGLMERFGVQEVYGMHNGLDPVGTFSVRTGPTSAAADLVRIVVEGKGGHAAKPHLAVDTILVAAHIVVATQSVASRNVDPLGQAVVSICAFNAGFTNNVIPQTAELRGTVRTFDPAIQDMVERRLKEIAEGTAAVFGARAELTYTRGCPAVVNHAAEADYAAAVAAEVVGDAAVRRDKPPSMGSEDFSFMLNERPGCMIGIGQGGEFGVHHPAYDFNDEILPIGMSYWARLIETRMPA
ncbi:M20 aminoacylase family protein [Phreatobacter oligotrophus]|jgi:amidohydrolase|uniref:M20 aminoacylase family protein n=1 Tax=Phreatobacter oligotrophus TaxID=1122261 RepID=UPI002357991E|nr:M20 aminoacylase family protein [Phreatobacter oligotrophus]MBX9991573.1 amidohydrolase [Phreatobacter oligotrophus]